MNSEEILRNLKNEFDKYAQNGFINVFDSQQAAWEFNIYPSQSQILEMIICQGNENDSERIQFHELCVLIATIKSNLLKTPLEAIPKILHTKSFDESQWDASKCALSQIVVFLGGACNPTTWRSEEAIPFLAKEGISYYNPQVDIWYPQLIEVEANAKANACVNLYVLTWLTRGISSLVESAYLSSQSKNLVIIIPKNPPAPVGELTIGGEVLIQEEYDSIKRGYFFLTDILEHQGIPVFDSLEVALNCTKEIIETSCDVRQLTERSGAKPVRHSHVKVGRTMANVKEAFRSLDYQNKGRIAPKQAEMGLRVVLGEPGLPKDIIHSKSSYNFEDFCFLYARELLSRQSDSSAELPKQMAADDQKVDQPPQTDSGWCPRKIRRWCSSWFSPAPQPRQNTSNRAASDPLISVPDQESPGVNLSRSHSQSRYDVFLGGSCGLTNWREKIATPFLRRNGCSYYDPQTAVWTTRMCPVDAEARDQSKVLLYAITGNTLATASLVEAAYFIGRNRPMVLYMELIETTGSSPQPPNCGTTSTLNHLSERAIEDHNRGRKYLLDLANKAKIPIADNLSQAMKMCLEELLRLNNRSSSPIFV